jgi:hypothetical protein
MIQLAITAKRLGQIKMKKYCPRCFWYLLRLKFKPPFNHFGGAIFNQMEQMQMAIVEYYLNQHGKLPKEFAPFCDVVGRVSFPRCWQKYQYTHESGVLLYGVPDDILELEDGTICVCDHKSATYKGEDDPFMPCYEVQVIGYGDIAEHGLDLGTVSRAALFYWETDHKAVIADPGEFYKDKKLRPPVSVKPHEIKVDYSLLDPLLDEALDVWNASTPPARTVGCKDCDGLDLMFSLEEQLAITDRRLINEFRDVARAWQPAMKRAHDTKWARVAALQAFLLQDYGPFADDGMVVAWDSSDL